MESFARDHAADLSVIDINLDEPDRRSAAEKLIQEKSLTFPQIIRAQGEKGSLETLRQHAGCAPLHSLVCRGGREGSNPVRSERR